MKQAIHLENTVFEFPTLVGELKNERFFLKGKETGLVDFGTVVVHEDAEGLSQENWEWLNNVHAIDDCVSPLFVAPWGWRMPHLVKALGAFPSTSAAMKNGWNLDIPDGVSEHALRINKVRGIITIHKIPAGGIPLSEDI